ncbi:MAG TPA: transglycosylase SLT domain-containing protein [Candidatus Eisenbacteria bacterium]|nr:transglycosylase SLT domain-containing protein [Candidatus Eisenbacteria bacterium]
MRRQFTVLLLTLVLAAFPISIFGQTSDANEIFAKAYGLYTKGKTSDAKELFEKITDPKFRLADYSQYYLALINYDLANREQARQILTQLKQRFPQSIWIPGATLLQAKIDIAEKNYGSAEEILRQLRADKSAKREIADEALYLQAQIREAQGDPIRAHALYNTVRDSAPNSRWAAAARKAQVSLRQTFPDLFTFQTIDELAAEADRLARERQTIEAETLYNKLLNNASDAATRLTYLTKLANLFLSTRSRNDAIPTLELIARDFPESAEAAKALYQIGQIYWNRHENTQALEYFQLILEKYPTSEYVDRARFAAADIHEYFGRRPEAIQLYSDIIKLSPVGQIRDDAAWRLAWLYYRNGDLPSASEAFSTLSKQSGNGPFGTAALYWQARISEKSGENDKARQTYRQITASAPESYYQSLSWRALQRLGDASEEPKWVVVSSPQEADDPPIAPELVFHLSRARALGSLSLQHLAITELDELNRAATPSNRMRAFLMREYFKTGGYARSLQLANQLPSSRRDREPYRYPLAFWQLIQQKAQQRGLDPYLVLALIRQESLFDARARSPAAALGLMQLLQPTAARVAKQIGIAVPTPDMLFDPDVNLTLGTQYLKDLLARYSNNRQKAIAAYNAGESAVDRWEKEISTDDIEEFVERIPYVETRGYVKLVLRNQQIYKSLYEIQK